MTIRRFSSLRDDLARGFLAERLKGATRYRRIAGYFRSSILDLVGEELEAIDDVRIVCNSELDTADVLVSQAAQEAMLKERWNETPPEVASLLGRERYASLYRLLTRTKDGKRCVEIRVVPKTKLFVHGKAGVVEGPDGKVAFLGSVNETASAFAKNHEIVWEDASPEGVAWVEREFEDLWQREDARPLPEAIVEEIGRLAEREEIPLDAARRTPDGLAGAALAEAPLYRGGDTLQPWQRSFVAMVLQHRETYGKARLLLADEVGLGKTLSLAAAALVTNLLGDGPVLVLCPSTLTVQWQTELEDKLGLPSAVWHSSRKVWLDGEGRPMSPEGDPSRIGRCPLQVAIVSTGLIVHGSPEGDVLLGRSYGMVVLDEAHKARCKGAMNGERGEANNLLKFMLKLARQARHVLLGTATPIQTHVGELWDLLKVLQVDAEFVLGNAVLSSWGHEARALPVVTGQENPANERAVWELVRNPLPPKSEDTAFARLRDSLELPDDQWRSNTPYVDLGGVSRIALSYMLDGGFFRRHNPVVRHTVLRKRKHLEEQKLIERVGVNVHPDPERSADAYPGLMLVEKGLMTNRPFELAYEAAENFSTLLRQRTPSAGFLKSMMLQRLCSSFASGLSTARKLLAREALEEDEQTSFDAGILAGLTAGERAALEVIVAELSREEARDPKLNAVLTVLGQHKVEGRTWLEHGCILFSQYYDTTRWLAERLAATWPGEVVGVYAGAGRSGLFKEGRFVSAERETIKKLVKERGLRLLVATDAACEGLNLQTLGTLINVDLPWNPARLEQRLGRIKRFGQARTSVDMMNLVYHATRDEDVYAALSQRMKNRHDIFGGLPDTIDDDWIDSREKIEEELKLYVHLREKSGAKDVFGQVYDGKVNGEEHRWEQCAKVLSRRDVVKELSRPW